MFNMVIKTLYWVSGLLTLTLLADALNIKNSLNLNYCSFSLPFMHKEGSTWIPEANCSAVWLADSGTDPEASSIEV